MKGSRSLSAFRDKVGLCTITPFGLDLMGDCCFRVYGVGGGSLNNHSLHDTLATALLLSQNLALGEGRVHEAPPS